MEQFVVYLLFHLWMWIHIFLLGKQVSPTAPIKEKAGQAPGNGRKFTVAEL